MNKHKNNNKKYIFDQSLINPQVLVAVAAVIITIRI